MRTIHQKEVLAAAKRQLEQPYREKRLALYLDAARTLAHLASSPEVKKEETEARFWELYWGELAFVESRGEDESEDNPSIERLMIKFCHHYFDDRCTTDELAKREQKLPHETQTAIFYGDAYALAHRGSDEIREEIKKLRE